ncbi:unnamed protein product [Rhizophagus irregularis]|nr:unnamed protein product [Rhizophagus irregularis]
MPPSSTVTAFSRAQEFSEDFFADNGKLMCRFCNHSINFQTKNTVTTHIGSKTHILDAFVAADIPLEKVDKLQNWLREYCIEGGFIPKSDTLCCEYLPKLFDNHVKKLKDFFSNKQVSIIIDETTDSRSRSVINILFSYNGVCNYGTTKLVYVDYLESVNNCTIGQLVIQILVQWEIPFNLPQLTAAYMKKCYRDVLKPLMPQLVHLPCLAHILNLIGEAWASISYFQVVHQLLANIKQTFVYSKSQKVCYISYLQRQRVSNPKNIPLSNATRWNTWFRMAFHVYQHLDYIRGFYNEESKENSTSIVEKINSIFTNQQSNGCIEIYLAFIQEYAQQFVADLDFFQQETKLIFPFIEQRLQQLEARIISGKTMANFGSTIDLVLQKFNSPLTAFCPVFQQALSCGL